MTKSPRIGIIGAAGWLGGAIARSLVESGFREEQQLLLSYRSREPNFLPNANWTADNNALVRCSDVVVVSVRPNDFAAADIKAPGKLVISVMAGVSLAELASATRSDLIVRSIPNAAADVMKSYTPWIASEQVTSESRLFVQELFGSIGDADEVSSEDQIDYFAALTGTGPAYTALMMEAMSQDAIANGVDPVVAQRGVATLLQGSVHLMNHQKRSPAEVVEEFIAYDGMTAAALKAMQEPLTSIFRSGLKAARDRGATLQNSS